MKVSKLIEKLGRFPPSADVIIYPDLEHPWRYTSISPVVEDVDGETGRHGKKPVTIMGYKIR
jgi:hypothetical protein